MNKTHKPGCPHHNPFEHSVDTNKMNRRDFLAASTATGLGLLIPGHAHAAHNIRELHGTAYVNKIKASHSTPIKPGDTVSVAHGGRLSFVVDKDAYVLRGGSSLYLESDNNFLVKGLNLFTGGLLAVFGKGNKTIRTRNATMGIRGTGIYLNTEPDKTYFCTCYGEVEVNVGNEKKIVKADHHQSMWIYTPKSGKDRMEDMGQFMGDFTEHTDDELRTAEAMVGRKPPF